MPASVFESVHDDDLVTALQIRQHFGGISSETITRWIKSSELEFPQPMRINNRNFWTAGSIRTWKAQRAAKITQPARQKTAA
jgi:predicted DNA-binding transcriptional regulator AlpA